ncbi:hypothetical protein FRC03_012615 [Tulasnella sp. 419]|nr:hypothetical protein FRC03_012615 [Tulasnella sp. 419]
MERPTTAIVQAAYDHVFRTSLTKLKDSALDGRMLPFNDHTSPSSYVLPGRSIAWKVFLIPPPPLTSELSASPISPIKTLEEYRQTYVCLLKEKMRAPDGSYEPGFVIPGEGPTSSDPKEPFGNWERNNPLSLDEQNPWKTWFAAVELRKTIRQDVERTFPEISYFRQSYVQEALTIILFLYSLEHPEIGYRQGMHELLAPIFHAVDYDSLEGLQEQGDYAEVTKDFCDRTWVAADSWALFCMIMKYAGTWYEWQEPSRPSSPRGQLDTTAYAAPIVRICNEITSDLLRTVDPALYSKMSQIEVEPQLYGIRWLRLLFSREFSLAEVMPMWDAIFAIDPSLSIAKWISVAMLIRVRNKLIPTDETGFLTVLLRYPKYSNVDTSHTALLVRQANLLRNSPNPSSSATLVTENKHILGIPIEVPEPEVKGRRTPRGDRARRGGGASISEIRRDPGGLQELIASRLLDVNSAVYNTVSELRRNLPELNLNDLSASITRASSTPSEATAFPYQHITRLQGERPTWEPSSRFELEKEIAELKNFQKQLGNAMEWALNELRISSASTNSDRDRAMECLSYVRVVLGKGGVQPLDDNRILSPMELAAVRKREEEETARSASPSTEPDTPRNIPTDPLQSPSFSSEEISPLTQPRTLPGRDFQIRRSPLSTASSISDSGNSDERRFKASSSFNTSRSPSGITNRQKLSSHTTPNSSRQSLHKHSASAFASLPAPSRSPPPPTSTLRTGNTGATQSKRPTTPSTISSRQSSSATLDPLGVLK